MKRKIGLVIGILAAGGLAFPALAAAQGHANAPMHNQQAQGMGQPGMMQGNGQQGMMPGMMGQGMMRNHPEMMQMMMQMHSQMMSGTHGKGVMGGKWLAALDADEDGKLSQAEITEGLKARMEAHDADGDGNLSIDEFEALHSGLIRESMVDRFQHFDANGDGAVTPGEIEKGAKQKSRAHGMMAPKAMTDGQAGAKKTNN